MTSVLPNHSVVRGPGGSPERSVVFLHGILGRGNNWRAIARQLAARRADLACVLVDLRGHGGSRDLPPPDSVDAAADDVARLAATLPPLHAVVGHSFGGKVALALTEKITFPHLFVVDSLPGARPDRRGADGTVQVVRMLEELPPLFSSRDAFVEHVLGQGKSEALAAWLAQNLERTDGSYRFGLPMARIRALLEDYFERDLWPLIDPPPPGMQVHLVIGGRSSVFSAEDREHARALADRHPEAVHVHVLENADHWVHVDDPEGLSTILGEAL